MALTYLHCDQGLTDGLPVLAITSDQTHSVQGSTSGLSGGQLQTRGCFAGKYCHQAPTVRSRSLVLRNLSFRMLEELIDLLIAFEGLLGCICPQGCSYTNPPWQSPCDSLMAVILDSNAIPALLPSCGAILASLNSPMADWVGCKHTVSGKHSTVRHV